MQKQDEQKTPNVERDDWDAGTLSKESSNKDSDEISREMRRGDETQGDENERDTAGHANSNETPQGREEAQIKTGKFKKQGDFSNG